MKNTVTQEPTEQEAEPRARNASAPVSLDLLVRHIIEDNKPARVYRELVPLLAEAAPDVYAAHKTTLQEHFKRRLSIADLDKAVKTARKQHKRASFRQQAGKPGGIVEVDGQLDKVVKDALSALVLSNKERPSLFVMSSQLVTIHYSEQGAPAIAPVTLSRLRHMMSHSADYVSVRSTADDIVSVPVPPPLDVVHVILEGMNPADYPFPALSGITELPILRQDGTIHAAPGYDAETKLVYLPGDLRIPRIPDTPSAADVRTALALFDFWLADFPFDSDASKAAILADAITVVIRSVIDGQVPLTLLDAPKQGTGKSLLAQAIGILATGRKVPPNSPTSDEVEMKKLIITWLLASPAVVVIDNVFHLLESSSLSSALTTSVVGDRLLSTNTFVNAPNRAVWFATGNNIRAGGDLARRCITCRLDARMERPHTRDVKQFRIPGGTGGFERWTMEHRADLIEAALILARNWYARGKPAPEVTPLGNFEEWTITVGGMLHAAGVPGFLANLDDENGKSAIDEVTAEWTDFIEAVYAAFAEARFTVKDLAKKMLENTEQADALRETLPSGVTKHFSAYRKSDGQDSEFPNHLGNALRTRKDQIYNKLRLERAGNAGANKTAWRVTHTEHQHVEF